jgi:hypothetical protein
MKRLLSILGFALMLNTIQPLSAFPFHKHAPKVKKAKKGKKFDGKQKS